jgi:hypothetical protein
VFDRVVWEMSIMIRRADFVLFEEGKLIGSLSVFPDVLPGRYEPREWDSRFASIRTGAGPRRTITPDQLRGVLPALSRIAWGQLATPDLFASRIWLHGRGEDLVFSYSQPNPLGPEPPDERTLRMIEQDLFRLRDAVHVP